MSLGSLGQNESYKILSKADIQKRIGELTERLRKIGEQINKFEKEEGTYSSDIQELESQRNKLLEEQRKYQEILKSKEVEELSEKNITGRIERAFENLASGTLEIENERNKLQQESSIYFLAQGILIVLLVVFYMWFMYSVFHKTISFNTWLDLLPYSTFLMLTGMLIGLCVYLKNRANKISIALSTRLFYIHYLEGLLKVINTISPNSEEAIQRINNSVNQLVDIYFKNIEHTPLNVSELGLIESKELDLNPYWKILGKIESLIKTIRS